MNPEYIYRTIRFFIVIGIFIGAVTLFVFISKLTYPFLIGIGIALLINPLVNFLENKVRLPRAVAVIISIILIISVFIGLITLLITEIVAGANYLADVLPDHVQTLVNYIEDFIASQIIPLYDQATSLFKSLNAGQQDTIMQNIQSAGQKIASSAGTFLQNFFQKLPTLISWIPNAATVLIFSLLATFFISKDWYRLTKYFRKFLPEKAQKSGKTVFNDLKKALVGFIRAQLTLISITLVIVLLGLLILRVDYAITIALVSGIVDLLPYLGTGVVFIPWIVYEAITGHISLAVGLGVLYTVVIVQRQFMEPKILSSSIGLNPLATLIALFVGFKLVGFLGLILGPVTLVIITTLNRANVFRDIWNFIMGKPNKNIKQ
ncbi:sporulation integral membrane protein YtvI [Heyndrickxia camelliae]|uniref:Sporulation integral membrane protein YtvI n=1 Tax=Heyndrickxia camelliae TaxID=1707093 RepID=A0A2N3LI50_9BACI|nr:sporulation integral membrane protein YtvI [Heyndrickxia camelliae]PKR84286.1 sporulation integral membrane protein YtvI [Heyndrickxia camelliae]